MPKIKSVSPELKDHEVAHISCCKASLIKFLTNCGGHLGDGSFFRGSAHKDQHTMLDDLFTAEDFERPEFIGALPCSPTSSLRRYKKQVKIAIDHGFSMQKAPLEIVWAVLVPMSAERLAEVTEGGTKKTFTFTETSTEAGVTTTKQVSMPLVPAHKCDPITHVFEGDFEVLGTAGAHFFTSPQTGLPKLMNTYIFEVTVYLDQVVEVII